MSRNYNFWSQFCCFMNDTLTTFCSLKNDIVQYSCPVCECITQNYHFWMTRLCIHHPARKTVRRVWLRFHGRIRPGCGKSGVLFPSVFSSYFHAFVASRYIFCHLTGCMSSNFPSFLNGLNNYDKGYTIKTIRSQVSWDDYITTTTTTLSS